MTREDLYGLKIEKTDMQYFSAAVKKWDSLSKPIDGLGDFEKAVARLAAIQKKLIPSVDKRYAVIFCADNGVVEEGISQCSSEVTRSVAENLGRDISSASTLGKAANTKIIPIDIGIKGEGRIPGVMDRKIAGGTCNFLKGPAMTGQQTLDAIETGIRVAMDLDADILATGEMGIGNTTTSTVLICYLLDLDPGKYTGRGAGLDDAGLEIKRRTVSRGVDILKSECTEKDSLKALELIGGLDIAGLTGLFLGAGLKQVPVVIDGVISAAAAVTAAMISPNVKDYMLASHEGREGALSEALDYLGLEPFIKGNMALGEGTGAIMLFPLLDTVMYFYKNAASFDDVKIEAYERFKK